MIVLADVLSPDEVARVRDGVAVAPFRDGRATAGPAARRVKDNEQARGDDPGVQALAGLVREALERHPVFTPLVRPARWSRLMFSRYSGGQQYGLHTDDAGMRDEHGGPLRTDLSFTLFLQDPEAYDGGALLIDGLDGEREFRPAAGSAVVYQTGQLHRVTPVTRGERLACVGWIQSVVRRPDQRELLFDLERVALSLPPGESRLLLDKSLGNLLRMWMD
ncbi:Fe2+-dependent dioxygenase [Roseibacterium beibuensis]|uniref:Fe2+-dependent dioxygenase n=1 Tax=[Roseibacterium] beibuensis TaxID=1193142 RepID=UPI00217DB958|nr:Fe2+-dependent dioxygenase [Roseibacterium beibuensis]MCS6622652.1 Fe2+-dependent dioxygenase [Roseibacterium beibuensis]